MNDTFERAVATINMDPMVAIEHRRELSKEAETLRVELAPFRAKYRGGTASPYDQERKALLSRAVEHIRHERAQQNLKSSEGMLENLAHATPEYKEWLGRELKKMQAMYILEARLNKIEDDMAEWDRLLDLSRTLLHWSAAEMRNI